MSALLSLLGVTVGAQSALRAAFDRSHASTLLIALAFAGCAATIDDVRFPDDFPADRAQPPMAPSAEG